MTMAKFVVLNCQGKRIHEISVPYTGNLRDDVMTAQNLMTEVFVLRSCEHCGVCTPYLSEEPHANDGLYPTEIIPD